MLYAENIHTIQRLIFRSYNIFVSEQLLALVWGFYMAVYAKTPRSMIFCKEATVSLYLVLSKIKNVSLFSCKYIVKPQVVDILVCF